MYLNTAWSYSFGWRTRTKNGDGPARRKLPQGPYGESSVSMDGSHKDVCLLNVGGLFLYSNIRSGVGRA